ncbi:MAG TPA: DNA polymerase III subunit gamma/tau [Nitrospiraceae bacterium]|nr:MAG: DNA polymerase III, subunit gamma and tau [Nitrospirae bacterium GWD2_44_7]OGW64830.1 MAG: DNA polymerase III, subunit gamma and tau [Nitrospirae bacterium RIFOXYA2_FULL_44_9]HBG91918.1 DNA polymerase III subunit gamma/tau [Nitrospiraceae bacterium]HBU06236.1 DNA polymerase III subunit gamma/tau [Nitrospiraceae bacterium]
MSYLVLARKWRPQGFDDLVGQEPIIRILQNSIAQKKIAHAYIFSGPRGVGKTSTARILAKALNCENGPTPSPCGTCASCTAVKDGASIDVLEIDGASNNSVDDIRDLREGVKYTPLGGRYKIYIIDEAHMLSTSAFNALLKTLEEPPPHAIFVLATTAPRKIPATIFSRCQHLPFRRISAQKIKERVRHIASSEDIKISDSAIEMVARAADGSMRDSLTILDQVTAFSSEIDADGVKNLLGIADIGVLAEISAAVIDGDREKIISVISELVDKGTDLKSFAKDLVEFFRNLLIAKFVKKPEEILELNEDEIKIVSGILPKISPDLLTLMLSEMAKAELEVRSSFSPRLSLEMSLIRISFLSTLKPVQEAIDNIDAFLKGMPLPPARKAEQPVSIGRPGRLAEEGDPPRREIRSQGKAQDQKDARYTMQDKKDPESSQKDAQPPTPLDGRSLLAAIIEKIDDPRITSKLSQAMPLLKENVLTLAFNSNEAELFAEPIRKNSHLIEQIASDILKASVKLKIDILTKKIIPKKDLKDKVLTDPSVKEVIELFDGRIIDVKLKENTGGGNKDV